MKIEYKNIKLTPGSLEIVKQANVILNEYYAQNLVVTLRQLYYQFVSRDLIPNNQREYKRLGSIINDGRLAGLIDWDHMQDRTRNLETLSHWSTPADIIHSCARGYRRDLWENQKNYVEVWIEKDALIGVIEDICEKWDVPYFSCRGYTSQSEMWAASQRFIENSDRYGHIIHLGDHDPSGKDMTRDIDDRLQLFESTVEVHRIALNIDQVRRYNPPPNPAKITDSRAKAYIREFGRESWELDALNPVTLSRLIEGQIKSLLDEELFDEDKVKQEEERHGLIDASDSWEKIQQFLKRKKK